MKQFFAAILSLGIVIISYARDSTNVRKNEAGISVGYMKLSLRDELNSPLIYRSNLKTVNLFYVRNGAKALFRTGLQAGRGSFFAKDYPERTLRNTTYDFQGVPEKDSVQIGGAMTLAKINLHYLPLIASGSRWILYSGPGIIGQLYYPGNFVRVGLMNSVLLSLAGTLQYSFSSKSSLGVDINVPVAGYVTRFPYHSTLAHPDQSNVKMLFSQGSEWTFLNKYQQFDLGINYNYSIGNRWDFVLHYRFSWLNYGEPETIRLFYNHLETGLTYKF